MEKLKISEIEKQKVQRHKSPILISNIDINKIVSSIKVSFGKEKGSKYFIDYKDDQINMYISLPKKFT